MLIADCWLLNKHNVVCPLCSLPRLRLFLSIRYMTCMYMPGPRVGVDTDGTRRIEIKRQ
jgi:hypothetical protein